MLAINLVRTASIFSISCYSVRKFPSEETCWVHAFHSLYVVVMVLFSNWWAAIQNIRACHAYSYMHCRGLFRLFWWCTNYLPARRSFKLAFYPSRARQSIMSYGASTNGDPFTSTAEQSVLGQIEMEDQSFGWWAAKVLFWGGIRLLPIYNHYHLWLGTPIPSSPSLRMLQCMVSLTGQVQAWNQDKRVLCNNNSAIVSWHIFDKVRAPVMLIEPANQEVTTLPRWELEDAA
jgi:hypothetical protein